MTYHLGISQSIFVIFSNFSFFVTAFKDLSGLSFHIVIEDIIFLGSKSMNELVYVIATDSVKSLHGSQKCCWVSRPHYFLEHSGHITSLLYLIHVCLICSTTQSWQRWWMVQYRLTLWLISTRYNETCTKTYPIFIWYILVEKVGKKFIKYNCIIFLIFYSRKIYLTVPVRT